MINTSSVHARIRRTIVNLTLAIDSGVAWEASTLKSSRVVSNVCANAINAARCWNARLNYKTYIGVSNKFKEKYLNHNSNFTSFNREQVGPK